MKNKILTLLVFLGIVNVFWSCEKTVPVIDPVVDSVIKPNPVIKLEPDYIDVPYSGGEFSIKYKIENPVEGEILEVENDDDWMEVMEITYEKVKFRIDKNFNRSSRDGKIVLKYDTVVQEVPVIQQAIATAPMIFKVQCSESGTVYLPLWGNIDCFIDWGDGIIEEYHQTEGSNSYISHQYYTNQSEIYEVSIYGKVTTLYSAYEIPEHSVTEVVDWGELGLIYLDCAFEGQPLEKVAKPRAKSFENVISLYYAFERCTSLTTIPENLFSNCPDVTSFGSTFAYCYSLTTIPENLFSNCPDATSFGWAFYYCKSLTSIPVKLFDNNRNVQDFSRTFYGCSSLTGESPYTVIDGVKYHLYERENNPEQFAKPDGEYCFSSCKNLSDYDQIPYYWKYH